MSIKLRAGEYTLTIGPDDQGAHGIAWYLTSTAPDGGQESDGSGGWGCAEGRHPRDPDGWTRRARAHGLIPRAVRTRDLEVKPAGWSQGSGHAPGGVVIRFRVRS